MMPYRPPRIGQKPYDGAWQKQRLALLREQPLCRLCLSAGRVVPATVVDHIMPLQDGGTNATENLQPLCRRCHEAVKTPADIAARRAKERTELAIRCVALDAPYVNGFDLRVMRAHAATRVTWQQAHRVMLTAAEGILAAWSGGSLYDITTAVIVDDAAWCKQAVARWKVPVEMHPVGDLPRPATAEAEWLRERWSLEYGARHGTQTKGPQQPILDV